MIPDADLPPDGWRIAQGIQMAIDQQNDDALQQLQDECFDKAVIYFALGMRAYRQQNRMPEQVEVEP